MKKIPLTDWIDVFKQLVAADVHPELNEWADKVVHHLQSLDDAGNTSPKIVQLTDERPTLSGVPWFSWATTNPSKAEQLLAFCKSLGSRTVERALIRAQRNKPNQQPANWVGLAIASLRKESESVDRQRQPMLMDSGRDFRPE